MFPLNDIINIISGVVYEFVGSNLSKLFWRQPLVALYSACRDQKEKDGKVWLLHARNYDRAYPEKTAVIMDISRREILDKLN